MTPPTRVARWIDESAPAPQREPALRRAAPWGVSLIAHGVLVALAFFITWSVIPPDHPPAATISFADPAYAPAPAPAPAPEAQREAPAVVPDSALPEPPALPAPEPPTAPLGAQATAPELPVIETAPAPSAPAPARTREVSFAGLGASDARDIVYVVDFSGAMVTAFPDIVREVRRSIEALHATQRLQVVLLSGSERDAVRFAPFPRRFDRPILIDATRAAKEAVFEWLDEQRPRGGTNLMAAMETALALRPDAVFLLGRFGEADLLDASKGALLARLERLNPVDGEGDRPVTIKTIQILSEDPTGVMRDIGLTHGGENGYKFLTLDDLTDANQRDEPGATREPLHR